VAVRLPPFPTMITIVGVAVIYSRTGLISLLHKYTKGIDLISPALTRFATSYLTWDA